MRAGYASAGASTYGAWLLRQPAVQAAVSIARMRALRARDVTVDRIIEQYRRVAFADVRALFNEDGTMRRPHEWDDETAASIAGIEVSNTRTTVLGDSSGGVQIEDKVVKVKRQDQLRALDRLADIAGVPGGKQSAGTGTRSTQVADVDLSTLDDDELQDACALARRLEAVRTE